MRDPERIPKVLEVVRRYWEKYPDLRLGQLVANMSSSPYYLEDEDLVRRLETRMSNEASEKK